MQRDSFGVDDFHELFAISIKFHIKIGLSLFLFELNSIPVLFNC